MLNQFLQSVFACVKPVFLGLNLLDKPAVYFTFIYATFMYLKPKEGFRLFLLITASLFWTTILKEFYHIPRPENSLWVYTLGYSLPSGGALTAMVIALYFMDYFKSKWLVLYAVIVGFSRLVLGVHTWLDVLTGYFFGAALYYGYKVFILPKEESYFFDLSKDRYKNSFIISIAPSIFFVHSYIFKISLTAIGQLIGMYFFPIGEGIKKAYRSIKLVVLIFILSSAFYVQSYRFILAWHWALLSVFWFYILHILSTKECFQAK